MTTSTKVCVVSGAAGFVGSQLSDRLLAMGHRVVGVDDLSLGRLENLRAAAAHPGFRFLEADLNDIATCEAFLRVALADVSADAVAFWHLAANSDIAAGVENPDVDLRSTFLTTFSALKLCRAIGIQDFLFSSTSAIYGDLGSSIAEDDGPLLPISNYGAMKLASEATISAAAEAYLRRAWIFRFPNVVGPRATHGVIFDFLHKLKRDSSRLIVLGNGTQQKPYLHVEELIDAMCFIWQHADGRVNFFNIAPDGTSTSVRTIAEVVTRAVAPGARIEYGEGAKGWVGDVPIFGYDTAKLRALGWTPQLASDGAIERAVREIAAELWR